MLVIGLGGLMTWSRTIWTCPGFYADYTDVPGGPPYDPQLMVKTVICGHCHGITSSRALQRRCRDDIAFRFLTAQAAPDFAAIIRFRTRHGAALKKLFTQSLGLCAQAGLVSLGRVALDEAKARADASRHRAMSYDQMVRAEAELAGEVEALLADAQRVDEAKTPRMGRTAAVMSSRLSWPTGRAAGRASWRRSARRRPRWRLSTPRRPRRRPSRTRPNRDRTGPKSSRRGTRLKAPSSCWLGHNAHSPTPTRGS